MDSGYKEPAHSVAAQFTEKKSRFITSITAVRREEDAKAFIERIKRKYPDATHNCTAYRLWYPRVERFSDDGEPAGTAGMPMLEVMKKGKRIQYLRRCHPLLRRGAAGRGRAYPRLQPRCVRGD